MKHGSILLSACAVLCVATLAITESAFGQLPATQLSSIFPPGAKQGATIDFAVAGTDLDDLEKLVFSHAGITAVQKMTTPTELEPATKPIAGQYTLTIAADVPPGTYEVRAI